MRAAILTSPDKISESPSSDRGSSAALRRDQASPSASAGLRRMPNGSAHRRRRTPIPSQKDLFPVIRSWVRSSKEARRTFLWVLGSEFPGLAGLTGSAGIAGTVLKICAMRPPSTGYSVNGGYAEYALARSDFVFPLPDTLDDLRAAPLLCAGIIGFRSLRVAGVEHGERVGLFGFGASAHLAIAVLRAWQCEVYVSTRGASHRRLAESLGATWVGNEIEKPPVELDRAVTFAPSGDVVVAALGSLRKGGVVAINAIHLDRIPEFDYDRLLWGERQLRSVANMTRSDARDFLQIAAEIDLRPKVTAFSLDQANEALDAVKRDAIDGAR